MNSLTKLSYFSHNILQITVPFCLRIKVVISPLISYVVHIYFDHIRMIIVCIRHTISIVDALYETKNTLDRCQGLMIENKYEHPVPADGYLLERIVHDE
jgi:hypothetical protein